MRNLPVPVEEDSYTSAVNSLSEAAVISCHQWQHGTHIDSLPKEPMQIYDSKIKLPIIIDGKI